MSTAALERANAVLRAQAGSIHRAQALSAGMSERQVAGRLGAAAWTERHPDVFVVAGAPGTVRTQAFAAFLAVRYAGRWHRRNVAVASRTAAYLQGMDVPPPQRVDLLVPIEDSAPALDGVRIVRASTWPRRTFVAADGLVLTSVADTIVDIAWYLSRDRLHSIVQAAAFGRPGLERDVIQACRRGRKGSAAARRAAALVMAGVDSSLHRRGHALAIAAGLPSPTCGLVVAKGAGPSDCVFRVPGTMGPPFGLVVEWDGDAHRVDRRTFLHDREKDRRVRRAGYVTLRYSAEQVREVNGVVADLRAEWAAVSARSLQPVRRSRAS